MSSIAEGAAGGVDLLQKIWPDLTPHDAKRLFAVHGGDVAACIRTISSNRAANRQRAQSPGPDHESSKEAATQLRSILPELSKQDATVLLASNKGSAGRAADAYFLAHPTAPRSRAASTSSSNSRNAGLPRSRSGSSVSSKSSQRNTKTKRRAMRYFGVSVMDLMALPEHRDQRLPRIIVYLCEYLLARGARKSESSPRAVMADLREMIQAPLDSALFANARLRFNEGRFHDCGSGTCMFRLLKAFIRELPAPLVPRTFYDEALICATQHIESVVADIKTNPNYQLFIDGLNIKAERAAALSTWLSDHWAGTDGPELSDLRDQCKQLSTVVESVAFSVHQSMPDLAEFFFGLPRVNRNVLEYLGVCLVKLDLMTRKGSDDPVKGVPAALSLFAETLAPHIMRPLTWTDGLNPSQKAKRKKLQESFLLAFFFFIKRKHNLMSTNERLGMDDYALNGGRSLIEKLLFEHVSSQMKLTHAFEHVIAARSVSPLSMLHHIGTSSETSSLVVPSNSSGYRSSGLQSGRSSREYSASPAPHAHVTEITSPPVTRQLVESMIEVRLDKDTASLSPFRGDDTWSNFAESGDEAYGLSPVGTPTMARKTIKSLDSESFDSDSEGSLFEVNTFLPAAPPEEKTFDRVLCSWNPVSDPTLLADDYIFQHASCLSRWIQEPFLPYDRVPQNDFFALDDPPDTAAFRSSVAEKKDVEFSTPPGEMLLPLIGAHFSQMEEDQPLFRPMFGGVDDSSSVGAMTPGRGSAVTPMNAINYDYAMQFPRTHADIGSRRLANTIIERFLAYPLDTQCQKGSYGGDAEVGLLNHALPERFAPGHQRCQICAASFGGIFSASKRTFCRYCARVVCQRCCNRKFVVPAYIMIKGDFNIHAMCQSCENHLQKHLYTPCLEFDRISPIAAAVIGTARIAAIGASRKQAMQHIYFSILPECPARQTLISLIPPNCLPYVTIFPESHGARISVADLCELQTRHIQNAMEKLELLLRNHVMHCNHCRQVSRRCGCGTYCIKSQPAEPRTPTAVRRAVAMTAPGEVDLHSIDESGLQASLPGLPGSPGSSPQTVFVPIGLESLLENGHSPAAQSQPPLLPDEDELVLCRTCAKYGHVECFMPAEAQCRSCTQLHPDVLPPERSFTPDIRGQNRSNRPSSTYLWDKDCDEHWY